MTDENEKIKIILLPGLDGTGMLFDVFLKECPPGFAPIVVDYPKTVALSYDELKEIVQEKLTPDEKFLLLGESFSGPIALKIAADNPSGLLGVILAVSFIRSPVPLLLKVLPLHFIVKLPIPSFMVRYWLIDDINDPALVKTLIRVILKVKEDVVAERIYSVLNVDESASLKRVRVPILYLRGIKDRLVGAKSLDDIKKVRPDIDVAKIDAPHLLLRMKPLEAWQAIVDFTDKMNVRIRD